MGVWQNLRAFFNPSSREARATTVTLGPASNPDFWNGVLSASLGNTQVNDKTVQGVPAFWRALDIVSTQIASLPIGVYRERSGGTELYPESPLYRLLAYQPSPDYDSFSFREAIQRNLMTDGDAFAIIHFDGMGIPAELEIKASGLEMRKADDRRYYYINPENGKIYDPGQVFHLKSYTANGLTGQSPIKRLADALGLSIDQIKMAKGFYGNGAHISGTLNYPNNLSKEQRIAISESWKAGFSGTGSVGKTAVLDGGAKFEKIGSDMVQSDYVNARRIAIGDISNITGVPSFLLSDLERATFSNIEHLDRTFVQYTLRAICKRWEGELERKLIPTRQQGRIKIKFNLDGLLRGDTEARAKLYQSLFQIGAMNPNEVRALENMNAYEGGNKWFVPMNFEDINNPKDGTAQGTN